MKERKKTKKLEKKNLGAIMFMQNVWKHLFNFHGPKRKGKGNISFKDN
jgi:hypothetical protein